MEHPLLLPFDLLDFMERFPAVSQLGFFCLPCLAFIGLQSIPPAVSQSENVLPIYTKLGKPRYPTQDQIQQMNADSRPTAPESSTLNKRSFILSVPVNGLAILEVSN